MHHYSRTKSILGDPLSKSGKGEHYRLTGEQSKVMYEKYGIDGIPFYFLVDRKGTVSSRPDFRDHELLVSTILEELKK